MTTRISRLAAQAAALAVLLAALSCGSQAPPSVRTSHRPSVLASTNVWASVVQAVVGDAVEVKSIIHDPAADPHAYESTPADAAAVAKADLVVYNGGGYDEFMTKILQQVGNKPAVEAVALAKAIPPGAGAPSGQPAAGTRSPAARPNEHVWYDLPVVQAVAEHVAKELGKLAPGQAAQFVTSAKTFNSRVNDLSARVATIADKHAGEKIVMIEPVARYLTEAAKLTDASPPEFVQAVEEETDPPAEAVAAIRDRLRQRQVRVLIDNPQTETPVTRQVRAEAEAAGIPVVQMTETLPDGSDYLGWMGGQINTLAVALG